MIAQQNSLEPKNEKFKKPTVEEAYASEPWWYDLRGFFILTFAYRSTLPAQMRLFSKNIGAHHLEAAIGSGTLFEMILKWRKLKGYDNTTPQIVGFDYAGDMLAGARHRFKNYPNIQLYKADAAALPFISLSFDTLNIANAIHCLPEIQKSFFEFHRVLKVGGTMTGNCLLYPKGNGLLTRLANAINDWGAKKGILNKPYTIEEIRTLIYETGFNVEYEKITGNCYDFIARKR